MDNQLNQEKKQAFQVVLKFFSFTMAFIYIAMGLWFLLSANHAIVIPHVHMLPVGFILLAYGFYRAFVNYKKFFKQRK